MRSTIKCDQCGKRKRREQFYAQYHNPRCKVPRCKSCVKENVKGNQKKKHKQYQRYNRERSKTEKRKAQRIGWQRKRRAAQPGKYRARMAVSNAIRDGRLVRDPCESCGTKKNVEAHHDDYRKPLSVRWLCRRCHRNHHEGKKQKK